MLDLARLKRIHLAAKPPGQRLFAKVLAVDYRFPRRTEIVVEGLDRIPQDRGVFLAMNHTDRYNYWPLQYHMHTHGLRYTATWVKGKYYQHPLMAWFMDQTGNIPLPSRGYVAASAFQAAHGRPPDAAEYRALRDLLDGQPATSHSVALPPAVAAWTSQTGGPSSWAHTWRNRFHDMMTEVMRINREALDIGLHLLVFPEGTRHKRLGPGHTGLLQAAWHIGAPIVPIGCNGSDRVYPGNSPSAKGGRIVYRVGQVLDPDGPVLGPHRVREAYTPFTVKASKAHGQAFQAATDLVMERIAALLDPPYQADPDVTMDDRGVHRFL